MMSMCDEHTRHKCSSYRHYSLNIALVTFVEYIFNYSSSITGSCMFHDTFWISSSESDRIVYDISVVLFGFYGELTNTFHMHNDNDNGGRSDNCSIINTACEYATKSISLSNRSDILTLWEFNLISSFRATDNFHYSKRFHTPNCTPFIHSSMRLKSIYLFILFQTFEKHTLKT